MIIILLFTIMSGRSMHSVLFGLVCLAIASSTCCSSVESSNNIMCLDSERNALLQFKQGIWDKSNVLASWESNKDCCEWRGIACNNQTGHVITLNLRSNNLSIEIDPSLLELRYLNYLDISGNFFKGTIPKFIGSLSQLKELNLSFASFSGLIPPQLGNLSNLQTLDLAWNMNIYLENLEWLSHLSSLRHLDMRGVNISKVVNWAQSLSKLPSLIELRLSHCCLPDVNLRSLPFINSSTSLQLLDLSENSALSSSIFYWIANVSSNFVHIDLRRNVLQGPIPDVFFNMVSLVYLDLAFNQLEGGLPKFFQNFCRLESLSLGWNQFSENIEDFVKTLSCAKNTLENLYLSHNRFWGSCPDLTGFSVLRDLYLSYNQLNGSVPKSFGQLSSLKVLDLSRNSLNGVITEAHFWNLSRLRTLSVSNNYLSVNLSSDWIPPFQLDTLSLSICKLGPDFPKWIQTQRNLTSIDLSTNQIQGKLPNLSTCLSLTYVRLSSNQFSGALPSFPQALKNLDLSNNMISGSLSYLCTTQAPDLAYLDISVNLLSGELPNCLMQFERLAFLNLGKNKLFGKVPSVLGNLKGLSILRLYGNNFFGELPSFENCRELLIIDLGANKLSGKIPTWIGQTLTNLLVLRLQSNEFNGIIPFSLCSLAALHVLDLSRNNISGALPHCFNNITALSHDYGPYEFLYMFVELVWKGIEIDFGDNVRHLRSIDISSNYLDGEIPESITSMIKLNSLNLSRNKLIGKIPENFGNLNMSLESLDLSRNQISGRIPTSFSSLNYLSVLDLSYNLLFGRIPKSTQLQSFNASKYMGNLGLCGPPLTRNCPEDGATHDDGINRSDNKEQDNDGLISLGFIISTVLGFVTGFWIVCGSLFLKSSWRYAYFKFLDDVNDWLYVKTAMYKEKIQLRLQRYSELLAFRRISLVIPESETQLGSLWKVL